MYKARTLLIAVGCMQQAFEGSELPPDDCSLGNPLHAMARIGLAPMCDGETRAKLQESRACIEVWSGVCAKIASVRIVDACGAARCATPGVCVRFAASRRESQRSGADKRGGASVC